jgi:hypothetical protein
MPQHIEVPGYGVVEFPDGMSDDQISAAIQENMSPQTQTSPIPNKYNLADQLGIKGEEILPSIGRGFKNTYEGAKQRGLMAAEAVGLASPGSAKQYSNEANEERQFFANTPAGRNKNNAFFQFAGETAPYLAAPVGTASKLADIVKLGAKTGAATGLLQYVPDANWGSVGKNTLLGGVLGPGIPAGIAGTAGGYNLLKKGGSKLVDLVARNLGAKEQVADQVLRGVDPAIAQKTKAAADRLGFDITPAEASGSPIAAKAQGKLGTSEAGEEALAAFGDKRKLQGKEIIGNFLDELSPTNEVAANTVRGTSKKIISKEERALSDIARPIYDKAYKATVPVNTVQELVNNDGIIQQSVSQVLNNPLYKKELSQLPAAGAPEDFIKFWDLVKRNIDDKIETASRTGEKNAVRLYQDSKSSLLNILDQASPDYKLARSIYGEGARPLNKLKESPVGRLANLSDAQLKNVSKIIFDPAQTDTKVLRTLRDQFTKENPDTWRQVVRNEMERRLDTVKGERSPQKFYNQVLSKDRDFNQFLTALKGDPNAQRKLIDMRRTWKNLINPYSVKASAQLAKSSLDVPRSSIELALNATKNFLGGKYDNAAIKLITSNQWDKEFAAINKIKAEPVKIQRLNDLFGRIAAQQATSPNNENIQNAQ